MPSRCRSRESWRAAVLAPVLLLGGCAVGIVSVRVPERLPSDGLPTLSRRVTFDVCLAGRAPLRPTPEQVRYARKARAELASRIRAALAGAGVQAEPVAVPGDPARFIVITRELAYDYGASALLSMFTLSVIPGHVVERQALDVQLAQRDPGPAGRPERFRVEAKVRNFIWLPFIVHADYVAGLNGGWESAERKTASSDAFEGIVRRVADELRDRLGREPPGADDPPGVACSRYFPAL